MVYGIPESSLVDRKPGSGMYALTIRERAALKCEVTAGRCRHLVFGYRL
jgi:hypothetical protein